MHVELEFLLPAPPERCFELLSNPVHRVRWQRSLRRVEVLTPGPPRLGTRWREWPLGLGEVELEIVQFEAGRVWAERGETKVGTLQLVLRFEADGPATRLGVDADLTLPRWASWGEGALLPFVRRELTGDLGRAAALLSSGGDETTD